MPIRANGSDIGCRESGDACKIPGNGLATLPGCQCGAVRSASVITEKASKFKCDRNLSCFKGSRINSMHMVCFVNLEVICGQTKAYVP